MQLRPVIDSRTLPHQAVLRTVLINLCFGVPGFKTLSCFGCHRFPPPLRKANGKMFYVEVGEQVASLDFLPNSEDAWLHASKPQSTQDGDSLVALHAREDSCGAWEDCRSKQRVKDVPLDGCV